MTSLLFRIYCLTIVPLLHSDSAIGSKHLTKSEDEVARQIFINNSLVVFVLDPSISPEDRYKEDQIVLQNQDLSDEVLKEVNDDLRREFRPIIEDRSKTLSDFRRRLNVLRRDADAEYKYKLKAIVDFMCDHTQSTVYLTYEAHRIAKTGVVEDDLRQMAIYLDDPDHKSVKDTVMLCARTLTKHRQFTWSLPNDPIIEIIKAWPS